MRIRSQIDPVLSSLIQRRIEEWLRVTQPLVELAAKIVLIESIKTAEIRLDHDGKEIWSIGSKLPPEAQRQVDTLNELRRQLYDSLVGDTTGSSSLLAWPEKRNP